MTSSSVRIVFRSPISHLPSEHAALGRRAVLEVPQTAQEKFTFSAIFSAGLLQNSTVDGVFFCVFVPTFPRR